MLFFKTQHEFNGARIIVAYVDPHAVKITGTDYYLDPNTTISTLADAAGLRTYDTALPQSFWDDYHAQHGQPPRGVWSYDDKHIFGEFVSLSDLLRKVGERITAHNAEENERISLARQSADYQRRIAAAGLPK